MTDRPIKCPTLDLSSIQGQYHNFVDLMFPNLIEDNLYLGDVEAANSAETLRSLDIKYVLSVFNDNLDNYLDTVTYKKIEVEDYYLQNIIVYFPEAIDFIEIAQKAGHNVLVHCHMGVSRSATIVLAFLMNKHRMPYQTAYEMVAKKRHIGPNSGFISQLSLYEDMNYTLDANNRELRKLLLELDLNPDPYSFSAAKRKNPINNYFRKVEIIENKTPKLESGHQCLCANCGHKLFDEIHIIANDQKAYQEKKGNPKTSCQYTYIEPQKWMQDLFQEFEKIVASVIKCPQCQQPVIEYRKHFLDFMCKCSLHKDFGRCLRFRIEDNKFKIESNDQ